MQLQQKHIKFMNDLKRKSGEFKIEKHDSYQQIKGKFLYQAVFQRERTKQIIKDVYKNYGILVDPHTAIGIGVVNKVFIRRV